jgi:hypothetical protein
MTQSHTTGVGATEADAMPEKPKKSTKDKQLADLVKLRAIAMRLTGHLKAMMPDPTDVGKGAADSPAPPLPPEFDRLLGDRGSIIDSFETLVRVVIRPSLVNPHKTSSPPRKNSTKTSSTGESTMSSIALLHADERPTVLKRMLPSKESKKSFLFRWKYRARTEQRPPRDTDWIVWLLLAGRGFGKTRTGAETVLAEVKAKRARRIALVAPTAADAREVMVEGESGILAVATPEYRPIYESSRGRLVWKNGAIASCYSADEPQRLRGPQHDFAWFRIRLKPRQRGEDGAADAANGGIGDREDGAKERLRA